MWLINYTDREFETCVVELKRWVKFKPGYPVNIDDSNVALELLQNYSKCLRTCANPEQFFNADNPIRILVNRDAGIGDLLLLEPVIRAYAASGHISIDMMCCFPEVFANHPAVNSVYKMGYKEDNCGLKYTDWDDFKDIRCWSETAPNRHREHRTDIYAEKFGKLKIDDKEPRLYIDDTLPVIEKLNGYKYIGLSVDASHKYRGIKDAQTLVDYILSADDKNKVVLFGAKKDTALVNHERVIDLQGKTTISELFATIKIMDYVIAVDSGIMHIALTLHIPTVCIFSIITPDYRLRYYTGQYQVYAGDVDCIGCGDWHMSECKKSPRSDIPPCMIYDPVKIYDKLKLMTPGKVKVSKSDIVKKPITAPAIIKPSKYKLTMPIIVQNEAANLPRFIELVMSHPAVGRVIAIDGGSKDDTVKLLRKAGAEVYDHPYNPNYHDMQALQRNISMSYVEDDTHCIIMDIDECFSKELNEHLYYIAEHCPQYGLLSRKTFKFYADINDPQKTIKDYPDYQPRLYRWRKEYKFVGSPHHRTLNTPQPVKIQKDIIHFEEEGKDRKALENKWSMMWTASQKIYKL
jgi:ADP-heptose:LPS heptosyltransferase